MNNTKQEEVTKKGTDCSYCKKVIVGSSYKVNSHLYLHNAVEPRFKCPHCSKEYFRRDVYEKHLGVHTGVRKLHICDHCHRSFVDKRNLVSHLKIHDEYFLMPKASFKCLACNVSYCEERLLKYHIRKQHFNLHQNEPTHVKKKVNETWVERVKESEICVEMTKINNNMLHIRKSEIIHPEKKARCTNDVEKTKFKDYISSIFATIDKSQYSKAICDYCNKEMLKKSLQSHIRERHLKLKRFKCDVCCALFSRHYQLVNHICGKFKARKRK